MVSLTGGRGTGTVRQLHPTRPARRAGSVLATGFGVCTHFIEWTMAPGWQCAFPEHVYITCTCVEEEAHLGIMPHTSMNVPDNTTYRFMSVRVDWSGTAQLGMLEWRPLTTDWVEGGGDLG